MEILHLDGMTFYCNASFPFKIHIIKDLVLVFPFCNCIGYFKQPVSQGAFPMIYVRDNTEVTDPVHQSLRHNKVQIYKIIGIHP